MQQELTLVVGVGEVGGALAEVLERRVPVLRHDLEPLEVNGPVGVMHICIPYQSRDQFETAAASYLNRFRPRLTIVNSTVVPGTVRSLARGSAAAVAYSPVRGKHARMVEDLTKYTKFVAGLDDRTAAAAEAHFRGAGMRTARIGQMETLELAKLAETTYFGVLIAFAQELNRLAEQTGADYEEALAFFDEVSFLPHARYFPGFIGGHCVIPNIQLLRTIAASPLFEAVLTSNQLRAAELAHRQSSLANGQTLASEPASAAGPGSIAVGGPTRR